VGCEDYITMIKLVVMMTIIIIIITIVKFDETESLSAATSNERILSAPDNY
jgi:hypothetical protein